MFHPVRGGNRGGRDQFSWDEVKNDKHRENYLGHSVMAPVGRWQNGKDLTWYAKSGKDADAVKQAQQEELARIRAAEEEAMMVALGLKKATKSDPNADDVHKTKEELARVMANLAQDEAEANSGTGAALGTVPDVDTGISGLGSGRNARMMPQNVGNAPTHLPGNVDSTPAALASIVAAAPVQPVEAKMPSRGGEKRKGSKEKKEKKNKKSGKKHKRDRQSRSRSRSRSRSPSSRHGRGHGRRSVSDDEDEMYFREVVAPPAPASSRLADATRHRHRSRSRSLSRERHRGTWRRPYSRSRSRSPNPRGAARRRHDSRSRSPPPRDGRSRDRDGFDRASDRRRSPLRGGDWQHHSRR